MIILNLTSRSPKVLFEIANNPYYFSIFFTGNFFFLKKGFGLPPVIFIMEVSFCFKYTMTNDSKF